MVVIAFRILGFVLASLPRLGVNFLAQVVGTVFYLRSRQAREVLKNNLNHVTAIQAASLHQVFINYTRYFFEVLELPFWSRKKIAKIPVEGVPYLKQGLSQGRGVVILTGHFGNWDLAGAVTAQHCPRFYALAEKLANPGLLQFFLKTRADKGVQVIPATHSAFRETKKVLEQNAVVAILADRDMSGKGIPAKFFGKDTTLPAGPALLAYETGCMLLPGFLWRKAGQYQTIGFDPIEYDRSLPKEQFLSEVTQQIAQVLEKMILHDPLQWCMLQPIWKNP